MNTPSKMFEADESEAIKGSIGPLIAVHATFGNTPASCLRPKTHPNPLVEIFELADHVTASEVVATSSEDRVQLPDHGLHGNGRLAPGARTHLVLEAG